MRKIYQLLVLLIFLIALFNLASCGGGGDNPEPDSFALLQSGTWKIQSVTVDGLNSTSFTGLAVTFSASGFTTSNGEPVWPTSGSWNKNADGSSITRSDGLVVSIEEVSPSKLTLSLNWTKTTLGGGRETSTAGEHIFIFGK